MTLYFGKELILKAIIAQLQADLLVLEQAVALARDTATHADCLGASKYETMGLEASYLAQGQGVRLLEVERSLAYFTALRARHAIEITGKGLEPLIETDVVIGLSSLLLLLSSYAE